MTIIYNHTILAVMLLLCFMKVVTVTCDITSPPLNQVQIRKTKVKYKNKIKVKKVKKN